MTTELIGVDWGTTNLRVLRIGDGGVLLESRADPRGAGTLAADDFAGVLREVAGDWLGEGLPVLVCGMAGARAGWVEAPYAYCPAGPSALAAALIRPDPARDLAIVPGVALTREGLGDVMRGEETQAIGLYGAGEGGLMVAPGTHAKWILVEDGAIAGFRTFLTGELFAAVRSATIVGRDMGSPGGDDQAFDAGVRLALSDAAVTAHLFGVRVRRLAGELTPDAAADFLSGLLIGSELASPFALDRGQRIMIVGGDLIGARYARALALAGFARVEQASGEQAVARGLHRIWKASQ